MKTNRLLMNILKPTLPLMVLVSTLSTQAQTSPEGHYRSETGEIVFSMAACKQIPCELQYEYAKVRVVSGSYSSSVGAVVHSTDNVLRILSNLPISNIAMRQFGRASGELREVIKSSRKAIVKGCYERYDSGWVAIGTRVDSISQLDFEFINDFTKDRRHNCNAAGAIVTHVAVSVGSASNMTADMKNAAVSLISAYQGIAEHLADFRQIVARDSSDARHLSRLEAQLKSTLKPMVDEKGNPLLPVTHRRVTEGSRMIMVLSTVLEEMMNKYDFDGRFLEPLKPAKIALEQLSREIRSAYGWEEGLAGSGSKALAALSAVLDTELRNMYALVSAFNSDPAAAQAFNGIFRANSMLYARVNASNAGDAAGTGPARDLLNQWNSAEFQKILSTMMSAPKESQASLQNRILMALTAMESIKDYVDPKGETRVNVDVPPNVRAKLNEEFRKCCLSDFLR